MRTELLRVYLSGPITGHDDTKIEAWRKSATRRLRQFAEVIDPASFHYDASLAFLHQETPIDALNRFRHGTYVWDRNSILLRNSDVVLANLMGTSDRVSIGSVGEMFFANALQIPIIVVRESHGNIHDHAMLNAVATRVCGSLDESYSYIFEFAGIRRASESARKQSDSKRSR